VRYVVKVGELYSWGCPNIGDANDDSAMGLQIGYRSGAWVTNNRELAAQHAAAWAADAQACTSMLPRVVRLKP
jgi:hypothetical protein